MMFECVAVGLLGGMILVVIVGYAAGELMAGWRRTWCGGRRTKDGGRRAAALTEKEIRELGLLDADGAVCKAVPHIVETVILEATESLAALKPQDGGAELSGMKAAGVIEGAMRIRSLWDEMLRASRAEKRRSEDRGRRTEG